MATSDSRHPAKAPLMWAALIAAIALPIAVAAISPLLAWRDPIYIGAGFAGILAMAVLLVQPLLAGGALPGLSAIASRRAHRAAGVVLLALIVLHVVGLWITSPPDVIDALTFTSPTPFSAWGVAAMWAVFATALLAAFRKKMRLRPRTWRLGHTALAVVIVGGSVIHAMLIDGTMESFTKVGLCLLVTAATAKVIANRWGWTSPKRST